jgi:hypothetical protein
MSTPRLRELFQEYQSLRYAESGWRDAQAAAIRLTGPDEVGDVFMRRVLETGMGVSYGRPFSHNEGVRRLDKNDWAPEDTALRALHYELIDLRNRVWAHTDADSHQRLARFIEAHQVPGRDERFWAVQWPAPTTDELPLVVALLEGQITRANAAAGDVGERLRAALAADI